MFSVNHTNQMLWINIKLWSSSEIMLHHHPYFFINFVFYLLCICVLQQSILLEDILALNGNTCIKSMIIFFPMVNWLTSGFVYIAVSLNWFMCHLQTFEKFNIQQFREAAIHSSMKLNCLFRLLSHLELSQIHVCFLRFCFTILHVHCINLYKLTVFVFHLFYF